MTAEDLRKAILQQAIQGKLVPQDSNDEPASVLLERIREEKARLVKEKKIKKDKNESIIYRGEDNSYYEKILATGEVKCIDDEIPFDIPESWEWSRLNSIVSILGDGIHGTPSYDDSGNVYFINGNNLNNGKIVIKSDTKKLNNIEAQKHKRILNKTTILVSINGTIGNIAFYNNENIILGKSACYFNIMGKFSKKYIKIIIETDYFNKYAQKVATGTTIKNVPLWGMKALLIPIPPLSEQKRIVARIEELMSRVDKYEQSKIELDKLESELQPQLKKSILQYAIQGKLVPQIESEEPASVLLEKIQQEKLRLVKEGKLKKKDLDNSVIFKDDDNKYYEKLGKSVNDITDDLPFEIPNSWQWCRLSNIANLYTGNSINETEKKTRYTGVAGIEYIATKDVGFDNSIDYKNGIAIPDKYIEDFRIAPTNSVLMCIEGGSAGRKIGILSQDVCFGNKLCCFSPYADISEYIYYYLQSPLFFEIFSSNKNGIIGGVSVNNLKQLFIPLPPYKEVSRIIKALNNVLASINPSL